MTDELFACRKGFQMAAGVFARAFLAQGQILFVILLIGSVMLF